MGITMLPDWGQQLGRALAQLGSSAADIANPHREFQDKFREAFVANPAIGQKLADLTLTNTFLPAAYMKLLPRDILDSIFATEPSPEAYRQKAAMDVAAGLPEAQRRGLGASELTGITSPTDAAVDLAVAPQVPRVALQEPGTVPTTLAELAAQKRLAGAGPGTVAADILTAKLSQPAQDWLAKVKQYDADHGTDFYQRAAAEHFSLLNDEQWRMSMEDRIKLLDLHQQDRLELIQEHESNAWFNKSGGIGTPELWRDLIYDPKTQQRLQEIRSTGAKTAEDRSLLRMQAYRDTDGQSIDRAMYMNNTIQRDKLLEFINGNPAKRILPDDDTRRPGDIAALNQSLIGQRIPYEAYWGTSPDGSGGTQLRFRSRLHKQIEAPADQVFNSFQAADRQFSGEGINVVQPPREGAAPPKPKPPAQVTHTPTKAAPPAPQVPAVNPDTLAPADLWEYIKRTNPQLPDSVVTSMVKARHGIR